MELTKEQRKRFDLASDQISTYYDMAYGRTALGQFMEAIEEHPELRLHEIYELMYDEDEEDEEEDEDELD